MATVINGTNMIIKVDDAASIADNTTGQNLSIVAAATSCSCSITVDAPEVTDKQSNDRKEFIGLSTSWTIDAEVFYNTDGAVDPNSLFPRLYGEGATQSQNGQVSYPTRVYVSFSGDTSGMEQYRGFGYITSMSLTAGTEDASSYSVSIQGTGQLVHTTVA